MVKHVMKNKSLTINKPAKRHHKQYSLWQQTVQFVALDVAVWPSTSAVVNKNRLQKSS
jgi:hypothetical protein